MPILSLCSGYGGLDMAVEALTGDAVAYFADSDPSATKVLAHHWPHVPNLGDITKCDFAPFKGEVDIMTAGFSCQDISNAGPREGINGSRSRVWKDVARAVGDVRPEYLFLENVAAIRSRGLSVVTEDLAAIGYDLWWTCLRASDVGAAHPRDRWFGVGVPHTESVRRPARRAESAEQPGPVRRPAGNGGQPTPDPDGQGLEVRGVESSRQERSTAVRSDSPAEGPGLLFPHPGGLGRYGRAGGEPEEAGRNESANCRHSPAEWWGEYLTAIRRWECLGGTPAPNPTETGPRGGRRLAAPFPEWLMGIPGHVTSVPGLTRSQQLQRIGNGVMPQQAYAAYEYLLKMIKRNEEA